jgi:hypothetical protein
MGQPCELQVDAGVKKPSVLRLRLPPPSVTVHAQAGGRGLKRKFVVLTSPCCIHLAALLDRRGGSGAGEKAAPVDAAELAAEVL